MRTMSTRISLTIPIREPNRIGAKHDPSALKFTGLRLVPALSSMIHFC